MEASSCSSNPAKAKGKQSKSGKCRRVWTRVEEVALLSALKELKARGFKVDNAFKAGYLIQLEGLMRKTLPNTDIRADPQTKSKITVWKKTYSHLYTMFDNNGDGAKYNEDTQMIDIVTEDWWTEYIRVHPYVSSYRLKRFPYFNEWSDVFGKDRATGGRGRHFGPKYSAQSEEHPIDLDAYEYVVDNDLPIQDPARLDAKQMYKKIKKEKGVKKRKTPSTSDNAAPEVPPYVDEFMKKCQDSLDRIAELVVAPPPRQDPASIHRKSLYSALEAIEGFDDEQKMLLAHKLAHSPEDLDIFFTMPEDSRPKYLKMLLRKKQIK